MVWTTQWLAWLQAQDAALALQQNTAVTVAVTVLAFAAAITAIIGWALNRAK